MAENRPTSEFDSVAAGSVPDTAYVPVIDPNQGALADRNKRVLWSSLKSFFVTVSGRSGGTTINGSPDAGEDLTLQGSSNATPGSVIVMASVAEPMQIKQIGGSHDARIVVDSSEVKYQRSTGNESIAMHSTAGLLFNVAGGRRLRINSSALELSGTPTVIRWTTNAGGGGASDIGLARNEAGVLKVTDGSTGGGVLAFPAVADVAATSLAGLGAEDVSGTDELIAFDEGGTESQLTAHAMDGPAWLYDSDDPMPAVFREVQRYLGVIRWTNRSRQARLQDRMFAGEDIASLPAQERTTIHQETFAEYETRTGKRKTVRDWDTDQQAKQKLEDDARQLEQDAADEWDALPPENREGERPAVRPQRDIRKPLPKWLKDRGVTSSIPTRH